MSFDRWVQAYKTSGILYAWASKDEGRDPVVSGHGENPDLDVISNGTHFGHHWFYSNYQQFAEAMQALGYVGLEYDGGKRMGSHVRGGGGIRHRAFVLWNDDDVNNFRVDVEQVSASDPEINTALVNGIRATSILYRL